MNLDKECMISAIKQVIAAKGYYVLNDKRLFNALIKDMLKNNRNEIKHISRIVTETDSARLFVECFETPAELPRIQELFIRELKSELYDADSIAFFLDVFFTEFGWSYTTISIPSRSVAEGYKIPAQQSNEQKINLTLELYDNDEYKAAYDIVSVLANHDHPRALNILGLMYENGNHVSKDLAKAFQMFTKSAKLGSPQGKCNLGFMYWSGTYVEEDNTKALTLFKEADSEGFDYAQYMMANALLFGVGIQRNIAEAIKYYEMSSPTVDSEKFELGLLKIYGYGVDKDFDNGIDLIAEAAENEYEDAANFNEMLDNSMSILDGFTSVFNQITEDNYWGI